MRELLSEYFIEVKFGRYFHRDPTKFRRSMSRLDNGRQHIIYAYNVSLPSTLAIL